MKQIAPFGPQFHFGQIVTTLKRQPDSRFLLTTDADEAFLASSGGGLRRRRLLPGQAPPVDGIEAYEGKSVCYAVRRIEDFRDQDVVIVGGGDPALDWTINLQPIARSLTLVHRRPEFKAAPASVNRMKELVMEGRSTSSPARSASSKAMTAS